MYTRAMNIPLLNRTFLFKSETNRKFEYCFYARLGAALWDVVMQEYGMCLLIHAPDGYLPDRFHTF